MLMAVFLALLEAHSQIRLVLFSKVCQDSKAVTHTGISVNCELLSWVPFCHGAWRNNSILIPM